MVMDKLPSHFERIRQRRRLSASKFLTVGILLAAFSFVSLHLTEWQHYYPVSSLPMNASAILERCRLLNVKPGIPHGFYHRTQSDRFAPSTPPTLIKNATIWTGGNSGRQVIVGNLLFDKGLVKAVGHIHQHVLDAYGNDIVVVDARGAWVSPG